MQSILEAALSNAFIAFLIAVIVTILAQAIRRPSILHALWLLVLIKLVTPPLIDVPLSAPMDERDVSVDSHVVTTPSFAFLPAETDKNALPARHDIRASAGVVWPRLSFLEVLAGIWIAGSVGWFVLAGVRAARFIVRLRRAAPASAAVCQETSRLARMLGLRRCPDVLVVDACLPPFLWTFFGRAVIVLPSPLLDKLSFSEQKAILAHELAHLKRRDHWVRWLELVATGLYWWYPLVWWIRRQLRQNEEYLCDAWVLWSDPDCTKRYAHSLLTTVDFLSGAAVAVPAAASGFGSTRLLYRRIEMIVNRTTNRKLPLPARVAILMLGAFALPMAFRTTTELTATETQAVTESATQEESPKDQPAPTISASQQTALAELRKLGVTIRPEPELNSAIVQLWLRGPEVTDAAMAKVGALTTLRHLSLGNDTRVTDAGMQHLENLQDLRAFSAAVGTNITDDVLIHLEGSNKLTTLHLTGDGMTDKGIQRLERFTQLETLTLVQTSVSEYGLAQFLPKLKKLKFLSLTGSPVGKGGLKHVKELQDLETLLIGKTQIPAEDLNHLSGLGRLKTLGLGGAQFRGFGPESYQVLNGIERLQLGGLEINNDVLKHLDGLAGITWLLLYDVRVTDEGLQHLKSLPNLRWLRLACRELPAHRPLPISAAGIESLKTLPSLRTLHLEGRQFDDNVVDSLKHLPHLKEILFTHGSVTRDGVSELQTALANTSVKSKYAQPRE